MRKAQPAGRDVPPAIRVTETHEGRAVFPAAFSTP